MSPLFTADKDAPSTRLLFLSSSKVLFLVYACQSALAASLFALAIASCALISLSPLYLAAYIDILLAIEAGPPPEVSIALLTAVASDALRAN